MTRISPGLRVAHALRAVVGLGLALALSVVGWRALGRPVALPDAPAGKLQCLSYTPSSDAGSPLDGKPGLGYPIPARLIERDVAILHEWTDCLRIYSTMGAQADVVPVAARAGMRVLVGAWLSADPIENALEIDRAIALARDFPRTVRALVIGNEVLLRGDLPPALLIQRLREVKARTETAVAYAEVVDFWLRHPEVADAVDLMLVHILPYWDDPPGARAEDHAARVRAAVTRVRAAFPGKPFEIGEAGWPSAGRTRALAVPSRVNAARVVRSIAAEAAALGVPYNIIEAVDQPWKRTFEGTVGGAWGLLDAERRPKFALQGPVGEWPHWREAAGFTAVLSLAVFVWAWFAPKETPHLRLTWLRWLALGVAAPMSGATLVALMDQVQAMAADVLGWTWGIVLLAVAVIGGALLVHTILGETFATPIPPPALRFLWMHSPWREKLRAALTPPELLATYHAAVMLLATLAAALLTVDGRYRDFPTLAFVLPAAAFAGRWLRSAMARGSTYPETERHWPEALCAVALIGFGLGGLDDVHNSEAWKWAACCAVLAGPWLPYTYTEARRLTRGVRRVVRGRA